MNYCLFSHEKMFKMTETHCSHHSISHEIRPILIIWRAGEFTQTQNNAIDSTPLGAKENVKVLIL